MKSELKALANAIKTAKSQRCKDNNGFVTGLAWDRVLYRHMHVVYCLRRGRTLEQIEPRVRPDNALKQELLDRITASHPEVPSEPSLHTRAS